MSDRLFQASSHSCRIYLFVFLEANLRNEHQERDLVLVEEAAVSQGFLHCIDVRHEAIPEG